MKLSDSALIPNLMILQMIQSWCYKHEISLPKGNPNFEMVLPEWVEMNKQDDAVEKLIAQINMIVNLCLHDSHIMMRIAHTPDKKILIDHAAKQGKKLLLPIDKRTTNLVVDMRSLMRLLAEGDDVEMVEAITGIYSCLGFRKEDLKGKAINEGLVKLVLQKIRDKILWNHMLEILAYLSTDRRAIPYLIMHDAVQFLLEIIRENPGQPYEENYAVILHAICCTDPCTWREMMEEESEHQTLSRLVQEGTSRAKRKASGILAMVSLSSPLSCSY